MEIQFHTVEQAAQILKVNKNTVRMYCREHKIPAFKVGRGYRIANKDLENWLKKQALSKTALKQEEQRLMEAEDRYQNLFENASDAIVLFDAKGCLILANPKFCELYGGTLEEVKGMHFARFIHTEDLPLVTERFLLRITNRSAPSRYEARAVRKNGEVLQIEINSSRFMEEGKPSGIQVVIRDITERRRAELALKQSEERYRGVVEDQSELICRWLPSGELTFVNEAYCRFFGKRREELVGHSFMPLIPENNHKKVAKHFASISPEKPVATHEHRVVAANGEIRWIQWTNRLISDNKDNPVEFQSVGRDVTDRREAENKLRESEEIYKMLVKASPVAVTATDLEGNITFVSEQTLKLHDYKGPKDLLGKSAFVLIAPEDHDVAMANLQKTLKKGYVENMQYKLLRSDGTSFAGELNSALIKNAEGKPMMFIATTRDISGRKRAEEERNRLLKAIEASSEGISILDTNQRFVYANEAFHRIHGYDAGELIGKNWQHLLVPENAEKAGKEISKVLRSKKTWKGPCEAVRKDGKKVWVRLAMTVIMDDKSRPMGFVNVTRDFKE